MLQSVVANGHNFDECKEVLKQSTPQSVVSPFCFVDHPSADITLDTGFKEFYNYCQTNDIPFVIISRKVELWPSVLCVD